ncbi:hypothetical protein Hanom_Chr01g00078801 [Helianthus anomalus]
MYPFTEKSAGDDESDVNGVTAHEDFVQSFEKTTASASRRTHGVVDGNGKKKKRRKMNASFRQRGDVGSRSLLPLPYLYFLK